MRNTPLPLFQPLAGGIQNGLRLLFFSPQGSVMERRNRILAQRLGKTVHVSPLRFKLQQLAKQFPVERMTCLEDWLIELANARGARIVIRDIETKFDATLPDTQLVSNEELVTGICQLQCLDRPQMLRLAAQLISRGDLRFDRLKRLAELERIGPVLEELAKQALRVDPTHPVWQMIHEAFQGEKPLSGPLLHWTRLAEPVMKHGRYNAERWKLVS